MIGIVVNDEIVRIPEPSVTETNVVRSDGKEEAPEPEAAGATSTKAPHVAAAETARESAMFPRMLQMVMSVIAARIMAHPFSIRMYVRSFGMSALVAEMPVFLGRTRIVYPGRTMLRDVLMAAADLGPPTPLMFPVLRQR